MDQDTEFPEALPDSVVGRVNCLWINGTSKRSKIFSRKLTTPRCLTSEELGQTPTSSKAEYTNEITERHWDFPSVHRVCWPDPTVFPATIGDLFPLPWILVCYRKWIHQPVPLLFAMASRCDVNRFLWTIRIPRTWRSSSRLPHESSPYLFWGVHNDVIHTGHLGIYVVNWFIPGLIILIPTL